ncbi:MAG: hypothetical protein Q9167_001228 [Letrouitia subvulpina]
MSDLDATTPRVFLARHVWIICATPGETEWTKNGRYTGTTDLELTPGGISQVRAVGTQLVGPGKLIDLARVARDIAEWDYGDYEGLVVREIRARRKEKELDQEREWDIWKDGCEGGESAQQVTARLDRLVAQIREIQAPYMNGEKPVDVVLVAHGLILRAFVKRWLKYPLDNPLPMMLSPATKIMT